VDGPIGAAAILVMCYLLGSVPFGLLAGRLAGGVDLRRHGSRRTGTTNALRTLGPRWAILVFVLDVAKGVAAVLLARALYGAGPPGSPEWVAAGAGVAAVVGHVWSVFMGFGGGRGVATSAGGLLAISPLTLAILIPIVLAIVWRTRYVSLGSLVGAVLAPVVALGLLAAGAAGWPAVAYGVASGAVIVLAHGDNIARLRSHSERRLGDGTEMGAHGAR
jgi:glycerol-3-phosphate acyltransferase PlsY